MSLGLEGWYDATLLLPFLVEDEKSAASVVGERNDAKTCHGIATGKN
jgi:hypothetical protein